MTDPLTLCPGCFLEPVIGGSCPGCGCDPDAVVSPTVLPPGSILAGYYLLGRLLGKPGAFGLTYLAYDLRLRTRSAIKEFMPRDLVARDRNSSAIVPHSDEDGRTFRFGLSSFLEEARTVAQLYHPNIARVQNYYQENGTAYLAMKYYEGRTLAQHLEQRGGRIDVGEAVVWVVKTSSAARLLTFHGSVRAGVDVGLGASEQLL